MKNRALLLCLKNHIEYSEEYAQLIGVSLDEANAILKEKTVLSEETIKRNCELFHVSKEYFLCLI